MPAAAIIGASSNRNKFGNKALRAFQQRGYSVYPVNPNEAEVEGLRTFGSVGEIPEDLNVVTVYVRPEALLPLLPGIAEKGCAELWLNPGTESEAVLAEAGRLKLNVIQGCSILAIGVSPASL